MNTGILAVAWLVVGENWGMDLEGGGGDGMR